MSARCVGGRGLPDAKAGRLDQPQAAVVAKVRAIGNRRIAAGAGLDKQRPAALAEVGFAAILGITLWTVQGAYLFTLEEGQPERIFRIQDDS